MKDKHIISILESGPLAKLAESEMATIRAHIELCSDCRRAYEAARISSMLLKERITETIEPSPFFQTRVLAAMRERQAAQETSMLQRIWRTAGVLVSSMVVMVAILLGLTFFVPEPTILQPVTEVGSAPSLYSTDDSVLAQDNLSDDNMSNEEVFTTLYVSEDDTK